MARSQIMRTLVIGDDLGNAIRSMVEFQIALWRSDTYGGNFIGEVQNADSSLYSSK